MSLHSKSMDELISYLLTNMPEFKSSDFVIDPTPVEKLLNFKISYSYVSKKELKKLIQKSKEKYPERFI